MFCVGICFDVFAYSRKLDLGWHDLGNMSGFPRYL